MIAEVALGRKTGRGVVGTFQSLDKRFTFMGWLTMLVPISNTAILQCYGRLGNAYMACCF